jgi:hypothetical protein
MKNQFLLSALVLLISLSFGCAKKQGIVGRWKLIEANNPQIDSLFMSLRDNIKAMEDTLPKITDAKIKSEIELQLSENKEILTNAESKMNQFYTNSYMNYRDDGTYEGMLMGQLESGTYTYDENTRTIKGKVVGSEESGELKVERLNADSLVISVEPNIRLVFLSDKK